LTDAAPAAPTISVVLPCFNGVAYVGAALRSVLDQGWPGLEVIVVDDGSTDGSAPWIRREFPSVKVIEQANQGVAAARNQGIAAARGEWVAFIDADDVWLPGKLAAQIAAIRARPEARMVYTAWSVWLSDNAAPTAEHLLAVQSQGDDATRWTGPSGWIYPELLLDCEVWTSTVLAQRSLFQQIGVFDSSLRIGEDYDLWLRASRVTPILRVARPLALYRQHPASITRAAPRENYRGLVVARALDRWGYADEHGGRASTRAVNRALARSWAEFAAANLAAQRRDVAWRSCLEALRKHLGNRVAWKTLAKSTWPAPMARRAERS
jgi:glycosyltransferase involved in cell wall biosynthesis